MRANPLHWLGIVLITFSIFGCKKEIGTIDEYPYQPERLTELFPLEAGKYIIYRTDSTVFTNFARNSEIHSYQEKDVIDAQITDALGRPSYRVFRFIRDTAGVQPWRSAGTYFITPLANQVEVIEDNSRFIKMHLPVKNDFSWKGNIYLNNDLYDPIYKFANDNYIESWDYLYENTNDVFKYRQQDLAGVVKIVQVNERSALDTVDVVGNKVTIPQNSDAVWLRGSATDTVEITAIKPTSDHEKLTVYNQTNFYASLNKINIPPGFALNFEYTSDKWYYPNPVIVVNNRVSIPGNASLAYIFGVATDSIKVDVSQIDTFQTKKVTIYNKSNFDAYSNFNASLKGISIPPGHGRSYELRDGQWIFFENRNTLLDKDPFNSDLPLGSTTYSVEKYAKGVGLVYQELLLWEYQPNTGGQGGGYKIGFGVKRTMIEHN